MSSRYYILYSAFVFFLFSHSVLAKEYQINEQPMFGGQHQPAVSTNEAASRQASDLGWKYLSRGDSLTAIKRFNQAWMFDKDNPEAYWGFGIIAGQRGRAGEGEKNYDASIEFLEKANALKQNDTKILTDLAFSYAVKAVYLKERKRQFSKEYEMSRKLFLEATKYDANYPLLYSNWAALELEMGNCQEAQNLFVKASSLGMPQDPSFERDVKACH